MGEWRKVTNTIGETGQPDREEDTYVFGAEIDGVFVPAVTKSAGYIEHLVENEKARQEQYAKDNAQTTGGTGTSGRPNDSQQTTSTGGDTQAETTSTEGQ